MSSTILIIDDDKHVRNSVAHILKGAGHNVIEAESGTEGMKKAKDVLPQLIYLDIDMPDMTGLVFLKMRSEVSELSQIPIIMLSAHDERKVILEAISLGADDYMIKPVRNDILLRKLKRNLARRNMVSWEFPGDTIVEACVAGEIVRGSEVELAVSVPIRFGVDNVINIRSTFFEEMELSDLVLKPKGTHFIYEGKTRFQNVIKLVGLSEAQAQQIRRKIMSWKG